MSRGEKNVDANEVELSAEELVGLSSATESARSRPANVAETAAQRGLLEMTAQSTTQKSTRTAATVERRNIVWRYVVLAAGAVVLAAGAIYAIPRDSATDVVQRAPRWNPLPEKDLEPIDEPDPARDLNPVRIRNAFDRNEVFEFPPGTSQQQARDAVAEILLNRAIERQSNAATSSR
jgi:hypothetical protein